MATVILTHLFILCSAMQKYTFHVNLEKRVKK